MRIAGKKFSPFIISVAAVVAVTAVILIISFSCSANKLTFETTFYFICYRTEDNAVSASSVSGAVSSYGGAGYILEYDDSFFVTVACYYDGNDANTVCESLKRRDVNCEVIEISTDEYIIANSSSANNKLYLGNLNTLQSLTTLAYGCANAIDTGEYGQAQAKSVVTDIQNTLKGLLNANPDNCFSGEIRRLIAECTDVGEGYIYSKDLRRLQIAIADAIINIKLY
ncbi:MAG: hypothetical protein K2O89_07795 [Clostridia bacterium]|nr:hypothetical protein [Clostridia bacterium]